MTLGITPILYEMLRHPTFLNGFLGHLDEKSAAAVYDEKDFTKNKYEVGRIKLTKWWQEFYGRIKEKILFINNVDAESLYHTL